MPNEKWEQEFINAVRANQKFNIDWAAIPKEFFNERIPRPPKLDDILQGQVRAAPRPKMRHFDPNMVIIDEFAMEQKMKPKFKIFWGGADLDPSFYNRERSKRCGNSDLDNDAKTIAEMKEIIDMKVPVIGICRGAQILNVVNGGILVQHIDGHTKKHSVTLFDIEGKMTDAADVSSTHHQMMVAHKDGIILAKDLRPTTGMHWDHVNEPYNYKYVTEVVYYPKTRSLCIQPHPEWMDQQSIFVRWLNNFINQEFGLGPINFAEEEYNFLTGKK